jgi:hypothetical protein
MEKNAIIQQKSALNTTYSPFQSAIPVATTRPAARIISVPDGMDNKPLGATTAIKPTTLSTRMPLKLKHIGLSISNAQSILTLKDNWDDEGARQIHKNIYDNAIIFLKKYSLFILNDLETVIAAPEINPVKDGSIDLEWHTPHARMLINIKNNGVIAYYGDNYNDLNSIKGKIVAEPIQKFLAVWMRKLTI